MTYPEVMDRGDGLQIWWFVRNVLNKLSWILTRNDPEAGWLGGGLRILYCQK
jgi:hypothetical protein